MNQMTVTTKDLVEHLSTLLKIDQVWLSNLCRWLREDGLLPHGRRGPGSRHPITPAHAGLVLLAVLTADHATEAPAILRKIISWAPETILWSEGANGHWLTEEIPLDEAPR